MKCFIHGAKEAVAACRTCGKGMCSNCSGYSGHTGVCPECRKKEFEQKVSSLSAEKRRYIWKIVGSSLLALFLLIAGIALLPIIMAVAVVPAIFIIVNAVRMANVNDEINRLIVEINKLAAARKQGAGGI